MTTNQTARKITKWGTFLRIVGATSVYGLGLFNKNTNSYQQAGLIVKRGGVVVNASLTDKPEHCRPDLQEKVTRLHVTPPTN